MHYKVLIQDNQTKERVEYSLSFDWDGENSLYWWTEGNFGCDCNRGMSFMRAKGIPEEQIDSPCSENKYRVIKAILNDNSEVIIDGEDL